MSHILGQQGNPGSVVGVKATGTGILVEMLTAQELAGSPILLGHNAKVETPQAYILDIGPALKQEEWGVKVGDRVVVQGKYVPVPQYRDTGREIGIVQAHDVKCVVEESFDE